MFIKSCVNIITSVVLSFLMLSHPIYAADASRSNKKDWTFLVFINGNNNLDDAGPENIINMEQVGSDKHVNVLVQYASLATRDTKRYYIQKSTDPSKVTSPVLQELGLVDMGDYHALEDFIQWGVQNFPAKHYFVMVWDHGNGWDLKSKNKKLLKDISYDDISGHFITTKQLGESMAYAAKLIGHKVDIYGSDACFMQMIEVAREMSDSVHVFLGSEDYEPGESWSYADLLTAWEATSKAPASQIAVYAVNSYINSYNTDGYNNQSTYAALNLDNLPAVENAMAYFSFQVNMLKDDELSAAQAAIKKTQVFGDQYFDLLDYLHQLEYAHIVSLQPAMATLQSTLSKLIIANSTTYGYQGANGLSIWLLTKDSAQFRQDLEKYKTLIFTQETHWDDALIKLVAHS